MSLNIKTGKRILEASDTAPAMSPSKRMKLNKENVAPYKNIRIIDQKNHKENENDASIQNEIDVLAIKQAEEKILSMDDPVTKKIAAKMEQKEKTLALQESKKEELKQIQAIKKEQSFKALKYLLTKSTIYTKFLEERLENSGLNNISSSSSIKNESDMQLKESGADGSKKTKQIKRIQQPTLFQNGSLRQYQLEGLEWLKVLYENGLNGILADEMGLGKTVQVIAFIAYLYEHRTTGPFLVCVPLSTIPNWVSEFKRFAPDLPVILYHGNREIRNGLQHEILRKDFCVGKLKNCSPVVITSFQTPLMEENFLSKLTWKYIIVDEGHRLKNHKTFLFRVLQSLKSLNRLLLTGTPLQNNLRELWSLLHFLLPDIFTNYEIFESWLDIEDLKNSEKFIKQEQETHVLSMVHQILKPFMLRRLKTDVELSIPPKKEIVVYCRLTAKQRDLYKYVLEQNIIELDPVVKLNSILPEKRNSFRRCRTYKECSSDDEFEYEEDVKKEDAINKYEKEILVRLTMTNRGMMYRKIVNHPYLVHFPIVKGTGNERSQPELRIDEDLILQSGKMMMLDAMTSRLIKRGHKILIFSTFTMMLDIIEDFVLMRGYKYERLDGRLRLEQRQEVTHSFNTDNDVKLFLISTRAGGLGLNLVAADTVILYDSDWNPQADLQAQDRCHRIGQTRPVVIYQFVTRGTIDETIVAAGNNKRKLEKVIIQSDKFKLKSLQKGLSDKSELEYLKKLLEEEEKHIVTSVEEVMDPKELEELLDRSEMLKQMNQ